MPQKRSSPPPVMTWAKASWVLVIAGIFDALRYFFLFLWLLGPALVGIYCAAKAGDVAFIGKTLVATCVAGAAALGIGGFAVAASIGTVMAVAVGFLGWLTVTSIIFITDNRTFKENPFSLLWIFEGIGASVLVMSWGVYRKQIKTEKAAYSKWRQEQAELDLRERQQQAAAALAQMKRGQQQDAIDEAMQVQAEADAVQDAQLKQEEAANETPSNQKLAA